MKIFGIKFRQPPQFIPKKYHHEIACWAQDLAQEVHRKALYEIENDDDFLKVADIDPSIKSCPNGLLKMLADKDPKGNWVSKRVYEIRESNVMNDSRAFNTSPQCSGSIGDEIRITKRDLLEKIKDMPDDATISVGDSERKHDDPDQIDLDRELNEIFIWKYWDDV